jgi:adenosylcobinamide hydrolase
VVRAATDLLLPALTRHDRVLTWAVPAGWSALSSAAVGGGLVRPRWVLNATVDEGFARTDLDAYAAELAGEVGLHGTGCALLTAADVSQVEHVHRDGVDVWATVGVTKPTWPHDPRAGRLRSARAERVEDPCAFLPCHNGRHSDTCDTTERHEVAPAAAGFASATRDASATTDAAWQPPAPGTVNIVVAVPVPLTPSALVQTVGTLTEAKAQVLVRAGVPGTGTASDAVVVLCPDAAPQEQVPFAGVRSAWGRRIAHAVHDAVLAGLVAHPWVAGPGDAEQVW